MTAQTGVDAPAELFGIFVQHFRALFEGQVRRAVPAFVNGVARGLIRKQLDRDVVALGVLEQRDDVAVIGDRKRLFGVQSFPGHPEGFFGAVGDLADPALAMAGLDPGIIDFGDDADAAGDLDGLGLRAAHAAQSRRHVKDAGQIVARADAELEARGVEHGVEGAVYDALRPDVHPAAGGHLPVIADAQLHGAVPVLLIVEQADEQAVGEDHARRAGMRGEQPHGMAAFEHQRGVVGQLAQILLDQAVLQPVLTDLPRLAVGDEFVGIERRLEVEIVVHHHLKGCAGQALALVGLDRAAPDAPGGAEAVGVDAAARAQLFHELGNQLLVIFFGHVAQRVAQRQLRLRLRKRPAAVGRAADPRREFGIFGQNVVRFDDHRFAVEQILLHVFFSPL